MNIGTAIEAAKQGKRIAREGWAEDGLFVFRQVPATIPAETIPKMQSLPDGVKAELMRRGLPLTYQNQFALVKMDNSIHGWAPSAGDTLAEDWEILTD